MKQTLAGRWPSLAGFALVIFVVLGCNGLNSVSNWESELAGKKLSMAKNSGAFSDSMQIWFCSSGRFAAKKQSSGLSGGGSGTLSMADEDTQSGKWSVNGSTLVLNDSKGEKIELELSRGNDNNVIQLSGTGFLVASHNSDCSGD